MQPRLEPQLPTDCSSCMSMALTEWGAAIGPPPFPSESEMCVGTGLGGPLGWVGGMRWSMEMAACTGRLRYADARALMAWALTCCNERERESM